MSYINKTTYGRQSQASLYSQASQKSLKQPSSTASSKLAKLLRQREELDELGDKILETYESLKPPTKSYIFKSASSRADRYDSSATFLKTSKTSQTYSSTCSYLNNSNCREVGNNTSMGESLKPITQLVQSRIDCSSSGVNLHHDRGTQMTPRFTDYRANQYLTPSASKKSVHFQSTSFLNSPIDRAPLTFQSPYTKKPVVSKRYTDEEWMIKEKEILSSQTSSKSLLENSNNSNNHNRSSSYIQVKEEQDDFDNMSVASMLESLKLAKEESQYLRTKYLDHYEKKHPSYANTLRDRQEEAGEESRGSKVLDYTFKKTKY